MPAGKGGTAASKRNDKKKTKNKKAKDDAKGKGANTSKSDDEITASDGGNEEEEDEEEDGQDGEGKKDKQTAEEKEAAKALKASKTIAVHDKTERIKLEATLSYNRIDLLDPNNTFDNPWNTRAVENSKAVQLKNVFRDEGMKPYSPEHHFYILMRLAELDPSCINTTLSAVRTAPFLKRAEGVSGPHLIPGGGHRRRAVALFHDEVHKERLSLEKELEEALAEEERDEVLIATLRVRIAELLDSEPVIGYWGVTVLNIDRIPHHIRLDLARNRSGYIYSETDTESMRMYMKTKFDAGMPPAFGRDARGRAIFNHAEAIPLLQELHRAPEAYSAASLLRVNWLYNAVLGHSGALVTSIGTFSGKILANLFTNKPIDENMEDLAERLKNPEQTPQEQRSLEKEVEQAWTTFMTHQPDPELIPLLDSSVVTELDKVNADLLPSTELAYGLSLPRYVTGMEDYAKTLAHTLEVAITQKATALEGEAEKKYLGMKKMLGNKIEILYNRSVRVNSPIPVLTPTSLKSLVETMEIVTPAILETIHWKSPNAPWFSFGSGHKDAPKGALDYLYRDMESPTSSPLTLKGQGVFRNLFIKILMQNMDNLVDMNLGIMKLGSKWNRSLDKNAKLTSAASIAFWDGEGKRLGLGVTVGAILECMESAIAKREKGSTDAILLPQYWPLDVLSLNTWSHKRNGNRDRPKFAVAALADMCHAAEARRELFKISDGACILRHTFKEALTEYKARNLQTRLDKRLTIQAETRPVYNFPDGIDIPLEGKSYNVGSIEALVIAHNNAREFVNEQKELQTVINRLVKLPSAGILRGSKLVHPAVSSAINSLTTVLNEQYYYHDLMGKAQEASEFAVEEWVPPTNVTKNIPRYNFKPLSVYRGTLNYPIVRSEPTDNKTVQDDKPNGPNPLANPATKEGSLSPEDRDKSNRDSTIIELLEHRDSADAMDITDPPVAEPGVRITGTDNFPHNATDIPSRGGTAPPDSENADSERGDAEGTMDIDFVPTQIVGDPEDTFQVNDPVSALLNSDDSDSNSDPGDASGE